MDSAASAVRGPTPAGFRPSSKMEGSVGSMSAAAAGFGDGATGSSSPKRFLAVAGTSIVLMAETGSGRTGAVVPENPVASMGALALDTTFSLRAAAAPENARALAIAL